MKNTPHTTHVGAGVVDLTANCHIGDHGNDTILTFSIYSLIILSTHKIRLIGIQVNAPYNANISKESNSILIQCVLLWGSLVRTHRIWSSA